jgi:hypothetical protein
MKSKWVNGVHGIKEANKNFILRELVKPQVSVAFIWCIRYTFLYIATDLTASQANKSTWTLLKQEHNMYMVKIYSRKLTMSKRNDKTGKRLKISKKIKKAFQQQVISI